MPLLTVEATAEAMMSAGVATAAEIDAALEELRRLSTDATVLFAMPPTVQAWAIRP